MADRPRTLADDVCPETYSDDTFWPGERARGPGVYDRTSRKVAKDGTRLTEKTVVPFVDSMREPSKDA